MIQNERLKEIIVLLENEELSKEERINLLIEKKDIFEAYIKSQKDMIRLQQEINDFLKEYNLVDSTGFLDSDNQVMVTDILLDFLSGCSKVVSNIKNEIKSLEQ